MAHRQLTPSIVVATKSPFLQACPSKITLEKLKQALAFITESHIPFMERVIEAELKELLTNAESNRRKTLTAQTVATSVGGVGTILGVSAAAVALALGPLGWAIGLGVSATVVGVGGAATGIVTSAVDGSIERRDHDAVIGIVTEYNSKVKKLVSMLMMIVKNFDEDSKERCELLLDYVLENLQTEDIQTLQNNTRVQRRDLSEGDHIYRRLSGIWIPVGYHHGVCKKNCKDGRLMVVDFGQTKFEKLSGGNNVELKSLDEFMDGEVEIYRRSYGGLCLSIRKTREMAMTAVKCGLDEFNQRYHLFANNCEHFATFLKIGVAQSQQVSNGINIVGTSAKWVGKTAQHASDISHVIKTVSTLMKPKGVLDVVTEFLPSVLQPATQASSGLGKACIVVAPIATAIDISMLVYEYMKDKPNIVLIQAARAVFKERLGQMENIASQLHHFIQRLTENLAQRERDRAAREAEALAKAHRKSWMTEIEVGLHVLVRKYRGHLQDSSRF